jgi:hypothetical protein
VELHSSSDALVQREAAQVVEHEDFMWPPGGAADEDRATHARRVAQFAIALQRVRLIKSDSTPAEVAPRLFLGSVGAASSDRILDSLGITHVVLACAGMKPHFPHKYIYLEVPLLDSMQQSIDAHFDRVHAFVDAALASSERGGILIHCFAGRSRSTALIASYLMRTRKWSLSRALVTIQQRRAVARPNPGFLLQLRRYQDALGISDEEAAASDHPPPHPT